MFKIFTLLARYWHVLEMTSLHIRPIGVIFLAAFSRGPVGVWFHGAKAWRRIEKNILLPQILQWSSSSKKRGHRLKKTYIFMWHTYISNVYACANVKLYICINNSIYNQIIFTVVVSQCIICCLNKKQVDQENVILSPLIKSYLRRWTNHNQSILLGTCLAKTPKTSQQNTKNRRN